jgi:hypothetical protein
VGRTCSALSAAVTSGLSFPKVRRVVLAAELGRFTADADTAPGLLKRLHNRCTPFPAYRPDVVAAKTVATQGQVALMFER